MLDLGLDVLLKGNNMIRLLQGLVWYRLLSVCRLVSFLVL